MGDVLLDALAVWKIITRDSEIYVGGGRPRPCRSLPQLFRRNNVGARCGRRSPNLPKSSAPRVDDLGGRSLLLAGKSGDGT